MCWAQCATWHSREQYTAWRHLLHFLLPCFAWQLKHTRPPGLPGATSRIICTFRRSFAALQAGLPQTGLAQSMICGSGRCSQDAGEWTKRVAGALQMTHCQEGFRANSSGECAWLKRVNSWIFCSCVGPGEPRHMANPHSSASARWSSSASVHTDRLKCVASMRMPASRPD